MKITLNKCHGGFSLSHAGIMRYLELNGTPFETEPQEWGGYLYTLATGEIFDDYELNRTDPLLAQVVEELGEAASGYCAQLEVRDLHSGQQYRIRDYDGNEWLEFPTDIHWSVAT